jgi:hypothetical protein
MNQDTIEIRIYDKDYTKHFQFGAKINDHKAIKELNTLLQQKGLSIIIKKIKKIDTDFF